MSVEYCVVRVTSQTFEELSRNPGILQDLMDELYAARGENRETPYIDAREILRGVPRAVPPALRLLYIDEFTTALLVDFLEESSAFFKALAGWDSAHALEGVRYGHGGVFYYSPEETAGVALDLKTYPPELLETRFREGAGHFRIAASGYFSDDQAILTHQRLFAEFLGRFYAEAAQESNFVLLLTV